MAVFLWLIWILEKKLSEGEVSFSTKKKRLPCETQMSLWQKVWRLTRMGYINASASVESGKQRKPTCQGDFTAAMLCRENVRSTHHLQQLSACRAVCYPPTGARASAWETWGSQKVCTHCLTRRTHKHTVNKPPIPRAAAHSAAQRLTLKDESPEPPKENNAFPGMSRNGKCRRLPLRTQTVTAVTGRRRAPSAEAG